MVMLDNPTPEEVEEFVKHVKYNDKGKGVSIVKGVKVHRRKSGEVVFKAVRRMQDHTYTETYDTFNDALAAYQRLADEHTWTTGRLIDLTGQKFGHLTVLNQAKSRYKAESYWLCKCDLDGNEVVVSSKNLRRGRATTCGQHQADHLKKYHEREREESKKYGTVIDTLTRKISKNNKTGTKGVYMLHDKDGKIKYKAEIGIGRHKIQGSKYDRLVDAVRERDLMEEKYFKPVLTQAEFERKWGKRKNLTGKKFGHLTAIRPAEDYVSPKGRHMHKWLCQCDCGNTHEYETVQLTTGKAVTCGDRRRHPYLQKGYADKKVDGVATFLYKRRARTNTGHRGITRKTTKLHGDRYLAQLKVAGKLVLHETFNTLDEAIMARKAAEEKYIPKE
ncbi:hypothetical protein IWT25_02400 [Secundilactobacillus pentosiphilus]|uniref:AP2/ERF domain-containing protein n=1 Tax=Secundilactobacillus pentosiphilus TaxID=1714682 RepID=A0A1Z5IZP8_9LACO|nr:hypothetical protein [Secundilactobacillus pentosiphilus]GAX07052.1 hypothetical protein IWT25_02400 [Secundilactobacillus pentosiphilus]